MLPGYHQLFSELKEAEKKGVKAVLNIYNRELERRKNDPAALAELCCVIENKRYEYYDDNDPVQRDMICLYLALADTVWYHISFPDEKLQKQFNLAYMDLLDSH